MLFKSLFKEDNYVIVNLYRFGYLIYNSKFTYIRNRLL